MGQQERVLTPSPRRSHRPRDGRERVRSHLLTALHLGRLRPGDRVLSVRRLASMTGLNRKTVHRAYRALVEEGLLDVRPGSGTFVAETTAPIAGRPASTGDLVSAVNRCRAEAAALGLRPEVFAGFVANYLAGGLRDLRVAVAECNHEQIDVMVRHLDGALGLDCRPVTLTELAADPVRAVGDAWCVITTDCHRAEVVESVASLGKPVYRTALDTEFPRRLVDYARVGPGLMVVADERFADVFRRLLENLPTPPRLVERVHVVGVDEARERFRDLNGHRWVWISRLAERGLAARVPAGLERVGLHWFIAPGSFERLRARLALDVSLRATHASET